MDLPERLSAIDKLPLSPEGRALARLVATVNTLDSLPWWLSSCEAHAMGEALLQACHSARVPRSTMQSLVDPGGFVWYERMAPFMRPGD